MRGTVRAHGGHVEAFQHVQHLHQRGPARGRRRHADDVVTPVRAADRLPLHGLVEGKVLFGDPAAAALHLLGEETRRRAGVEAVAALVADAFQRGRQIGLHQGVSRGVGLAVPEELGEGRRVVAERLQPSGQRIGQAFADRKAVTCQGDRGLYQARPSGRPVFLVGLGEAGHRTRDAHRQMAAVVDLVGVLAVLVQEHLRVGVERCLLPEVHGRCAPVRETDHHEAAAADVARGRVRDRQRESGGDRGIDGVAPRPQHLRPGPARVRICRDHHPSTRLDDAVRDGDLGRFGGRRATGGDKEGRQERHGLEEWTQVHLGFRTPVCWPLQFPTAAATFPSRSGSGISDDTRMAESPSTCESRPPPSTGSLRRKKRERSSTTL